MLCRHRCGRHWVIKISVESLKALESSAERAPSNPEAQENWQKSGCHRSVCCGKHCCRSQCFLILEHRGKVALLQHRE